MEIKITQSAIEVLKDKISMGGNKSGVRVYVAGVG